MALGTRRTMDCDPRRPPPPGIDHSSACASSSNWTESLPENTNHSAIMAICRMPTAALGWLRYVATASATAGPVVVHPVARAKIINVSAADPVSDRGVGSMRAVAAPRFLTLDRLDRFSGTKGCGTGQR